MNTASSDIDQKIVSLSASNFPITAYDPFYLARQLDTPIWVFDIDNRHIIYANKSACALWSASSEEALCNRDLSTDMSVTVARRLRQYREDFIRSNQIFNEIWTLYPTNVPIITNVKFSGFKLADGRVAMLCEASEVTEVSAQNIRSCEALLHTDVMIALYEQDGSTLYMNPAARSSTVRPYQSLIESFVNLNIANDFLQKVRSEGECRTVAQITTTQGDQWHDLSAKSCRDAVTGTPSILLTSIDVTDLKEARDNARFLADRDQLTGCFNRSYLQRIVTKKSIEDGTEEYVFVYFDIDQFKQINDQFGHEAGDEVLRQIAFRVKNVIRPGDVIARIGGDEFGILMTDEGWSEGLDPLIERIRAAISIPVYISSFRIDIAVSMGVTTFCIKTEEFSRVMSEADIALYSAKQTGKNKAVIFDHTLGNAARKRDQLEIELRLAIRRQEFILHYQPRVDTNSDRVVAAEALVRWAHPDRGLIYPDEFIPLCEENGMIEDLGELIVRMGLAQVIQWKDEGKNIRLSLNISPRQFKSNRLILLLEEFASKADFPAESIELEITENALIGDPDEIAQKLSIITEMGYSIAIDDFGRGYSNLFYISKFPIKCLKVDRAFISQIPASGPILELILSLGKQTDTIVVAEGVETAEQFEWLKARGCDQVQGFYFSKARSVEKFLEYSGY